MATGQVSQSDVAVVTASTAQDVRVTQSDVVVVFNLPSEEARVSQTDTAYVADTGTDAQISQADITVIMRGRVDDPSLRAWTFTLDGHDFYVLRLGNDETLVYDVITQQWYNWATAESSFWNVYNGINWIGGNSFASTFGSNVLVGSDSNGAVYFLDPDKADDDSAVTGRDASPFERQVTAQIPLRGYDRRSVYEVQLIGSTGELSNESLTDVELQYSDDRGDNYISAGVVTTAQANYTLRTTWRSLGSFTSPGRIFRLVDDGALTRIDSFTMNSDFDTNGA